MGLEVVNDGETTYFFCSGCLACWHLELGYVRRVAPTTCHGCHRREQCLLAAAHAGTAGD